METADDNARPQHLSRRRFIIVGGTGLAATGLGTGIRPVLTAAAAAPTFTLDLVRREDMAVLTFEFHNLALSTDGPTPMLNRVDPAQQALVVVRLGSQHLMEQPTKWENGEPDPLPDLGELQTKAVAPSRVAFLVPQTVKSFPYTEDALFEWWRWVMQVHGRALAPDASIPGDLPAVQTPPAELQTDLLLVDWLHLSPDGQSTWLHPARPVTKDGRTELWHTILRLRDEDGRPDTSRRSPTIRAVSSDKVTAPEDARFTALRGTGQEDAPEQIVRVTTEYGLDDALPADRKVIAPVTAELLLLSSIGSSVELAGNWRPGLAAQGVSIAKWLHRSTLGRDNYIRVETYGFLFPFGHRAVLVNETQRRIASNGVAYLFQKDFIVVREPVKTYPGYGDEKYEGRRSPFREVRLTTTVTPDLPPKADRDFIGTSNASFWVPTRDPATGDIHDLPFPVVATDWEGRTVQFNASLAYFDADEAVAGSVLAGLINDYNRYETFQKFDATDEEKILNARRTVAMSGEKVAFAAPQQPGDTAYPVNVLYLGAYTGQAAASDLGQRDLPNFYPAMLAAEVRLPAVEALGKPNNAPFIGYDPAFTVVSAAKAAEDNKAGTFARVQANITTLGEIIHHLEDPATFDPPDLDATIGVSFGGSGGGPGGDKVGGIAIPNLEVGALSRTFGPLSGSIDAITEMATGAFDPQDFFPDSATLLGGIKLKDVIDKILPGGPGGGGPKIITTLEYDNGDNAPPTAVMTTLDWEPRIFGPDQPGNPPVSALSLIPYGVGGKHATMRLRGEFRTVFGGESTSKIRGELYDFTLNLIKPGDGLLDFIALIFNRFAFEQQGRAKPTFDTDIAEVEFRGPLSFINTLQQYLSLGSGPSIELQPSGVSIGYALEIPTVSVGVFSLQNMSFSAGLELPFNGSPVIAKFGFASPENRFLVSVSIFGGGGYFALELDTTRLRKLEAAIEFGGALALNIVIASGSLSVMAGIYFKLEYNEATDENDITLAGYLRAIGRLSVLGLITITAEFYLALEYKSADNSMEGIAILKVTVEVLFFSKTVEIEVRKKFAGPGGGNLRAVAASRHEFGDLMSQSDWNTYVDSFAG
jgi:hypothetical protein